jgi:hypothetical protein
LIKAIKKKRELLILTPKRGVGWEFGGSVSSQLALLINVMCQVHYHAAFRRAR